MENEYEIIGYEQISGVKLFLVDLSYRNLHMHKEFELSMVLENSLEVYTYKHLSTHPRGSILLFNPNQAHELNACHGSVKILSLQVAPSFFSKSYPKIQQLEFETFNLHEKCKPFIIHKLSEDFLLLSKIYFEKKPHYELLCTSIISSVFYTLVENMPYRLIPKKEMLHKEHMSKRLKRILSYADEHFTEKILLSTIAKAEEISVPYLSHCFKNTFGISFQKYIELLRFREAKHLLKNSDMRITDICLSCGFSDYRYLNRACLQQLGCSPKEYRKKRATQKQTQQAQNSITMQRILPLEECLLVLQKFACGLAK